MPTSAQEKGKARHKRLIDPTDQKNPVKQRMHKPPMIQMQATKTNIGPIVAITSHIRTKQMTKETST
eukprot:2405574-Amphidinium_carterae.1